MEENNNKEPEQTTPTDTSGETPMEEQSMSEPVQASQQLDIQGAQEQSSKKNMILGAGVLLVIIVGVFWFFSSGRDGEPLVNPGETNTSFEADTEVAIVNGESLYGQALTLQMAQAAQSLGYPSLGQVDPGTLAILQSQSVDAIVNTELIVQDAKESGITVEQEEVDAEFQKLADQIGGVEAADERLQTLGMTIESFKENLVDDLLIRKYLENVDGVDSIEVSKEEVEAFYNQAVGEPTADTPPLEAVEDQITEQLRTEKLQEILSEVVEELREDADIEVLIE